MRPWAVQRDDRLALPGGVAQRKARLGEGDFASLPSHMTRQITAADPSLGGSLLTHPGEQRRHRLCLCSQITFGAEGWLGRYGARESGIDGVGVEGEIKPRGPLRVEIR